MKPLLTLPLFLVNFFIGQAQTTGPFPTLTKMLVDKNYHVIFGYDATTTRIKNIDMQENPDYPSWIWIADFKGEHYRDSISIYYTEGASADPEFAVYTKNGKKIGQYSCTEFYINSSGTIYTSGHVNKMYNRRQKYQLQKDTIIQVRQPYCYVGVKGNILKDITLYSTKTGNEIVAQLPKGYEVEILLADTGTKDYEIDYNFLVKTEFGLVGWLKITNEDLYGSILKELHYAGD